MFFAETDGARKKRGDENDPHAEDRCTIGYSTFRHYKHIAKLRLKDPMERTGYEKAFVERLEQKTITSWSDARYAMYGRKREVQQEQQDEESGGDEESREDEESGEDEAWWDEEDEAYEEGEEDGEDVEWDGKSQAAEEWDGWVEEDTGSVYLSALIKLAAYADKYVPEGEGLPTVSAAVRLTEKEEVAIKWAYAHCRDVLLVEEESPSATPSPKRRRLECPGAPGGRSEDTRSPLASLSMPLDEDTRSRYGVVPGLGTDGEHEGTRLEHCLSMGAMG